MNLLSKSARLYRSRST